MNRSGASRLLSIDLGGGACALAAIALLIIIGIHPITRMKQDQRERTSRLVSLRAQADERLAEIRSIRQRLDDDERRADSKQLNLLRPSDLNTRLAAIIEHTTHHGLEVLAIKPGDRVEGELHGRTPIDIGLSGPLPDVVRYLHEMRRESADLVVRRLDIRAAQGGAGVVALIRADWLTRSE